MSWSAINPSQSRACNCVGPQNGDPVCPCMMPAYRERKAKDDLWERVKSQDSDIVPLYLEAHVTIEPVFDDRRDRAGLIAKKHGFKLAHLLMKKERAATEQRSDKDTFMTGHSKSKKDINERTVTLVTELQHAGYVVWRYKIEDTLLDSRSEDVFGLL